MIESFVEGRVRLRSPLLADAAFAERLRSGLLNIGGVERAEVNLRTNGLLLEYDKKRLPLPLLKKAVPLLLCAGSLENLPADERLSALNDILKALRDLTVTNAGI